MLLHSTDMRSSKPYISSPSGRGDIKLATYLVALALLFSLELLTGCATTQPATPIVTSAPTIDISDEHQIALQQIQSEQWQAARETLTRMTEQDPTLAGPWINLGITRTMLGDRTGAEAAFKAAIDANNRAIEAYNQLGMLYRRHGRLDEAQFIYEEALKLEPENVNLLWNLAILYDRYLPNPHRSLQHYQRYQQLTGSDDASLLAWIAELQKRDQGNDMTARAKP